MRYEADQTKRKEPPELKENVIRNIAICFFLPPILMVLTVFCIGTSIVHRETIDTTAELITRKLVLSLEPVHFLLGLSLGLIILIEYFINKD